MKSLRHTHTSGRFNVGASVYEHWLDAYMSGSDLITATEVDNNQRARCLLEPGWGATYGDKSPRDDCGIAWRRDVAEKLWAETMPLSRFRYQNDRGWTTGTTYGAFGAFVLEEARLGVGVMHTPHGMQTELRNSLRRDAKVRGDVGQAYVAITDAAEHHMAAIAKEHKLDALLLCADWNLDLRQTWVHEWFHQYTAGTGLHLNWRPPYPTRGTHGHEIIDAALFKGMKLIGGPKLRLRDASSDHTAWAEEFRLAA